MNRCPALSLFAIFAALRCAPESVIDALPHAVAAGLPPLTSWLPDFLRFHGARGEGIEGGWTVVTVDRPVRPFACGPYRVRFRVQRG